MLAVVNALGIDRSQRSSDCLPQFSLKFELEKYYARKLWREKRKFYKIPPLCAQAAAVDDGKLEFHSTARHIKCKWILSNKCERANTLENAT